MKKKSTSKRNGDKAKRRKKTSTHKEAKVDFLKKFSDLEGDERKNFLIKIMSQDLPKFKLTLQDQIKHGLDNIDLLKNQMEQRNRENDVTLSLKLINNIVQLMQYKKYRSNSSDYNHCYSFRIFGAYSKTEKIAAADFLMEALLSIRSQDAFLRPDSTAKNHINALKQKGSQLASAAKNAVEEIESQLEKEGYSSTSCFGC